MVDNKTFCEEVQDNLVNNILPFWSDKMKDEAGGFYGQMDFDGRIHDDAPRGAILNARILWSFSGAYNLLGKSEYIDSARHSYEYFIKHFIDREYGGVFWSVNSDGTPLDTKKQFYALGFAIYGLTEYYKASADESALKEAINIYNLIERYSYLEKEGGYIEATKRDWTPIIDMRLSDKDANQPFSMNSHLHILEPYTNLYRVWKDDGLKKVIIKLLDIFCDKIYDPISGHLGLFFDLDWNSMDAGYSFGHDIEATWLMLEAALVVDDEIVLKKVRPIADRIAKASLEGLHKDGSMMYEQHGNGEFDTERHWWVQAETVVGLVWWWKYHGREDGVDMAKRCWAYIKEKIVDNQGGEWWWSRKGDGSINTMQDKAGFWKCPYHNSRMCIEVLENLKFKNNE